MKLNDLKSKVKNLLILDKNILRHFEPKEDVLNANIKYWLKKGELIGLKRGSYILRDRYKEEPLKDVYLEYLANQLVKPSYVSGEYVLAKYGVLSEPVQTITSMTTKTSREMISEPGVFRYYNLTKKLFTGYRVKYFYNSPVLIAEKTKAVFDYLYLRFLKNQPVNEESVDNLRFNWENISSREFKQAGKYVDLISSQRLNVLFKLIKNKYYA